MIIPEDAETRMSGHGGACRARITAVGDGARLFDAGERSSLEAQSRIWALADAVRAWPGIEEVVIGMANLLVIHDVVKTDVAELDRKLHDAWNAGKSVTVEGQLIVIDVIYGGEYGPDLNSVADRLGRTPREVIELHKRAEYVVYANGSSPGFAYLGGLPAALALPRRAVPVPRAEAGSLLLGGDQTGVTAYAGPTGWHVLGRAFSPVFDIDGQPPALLAPGDRVRFNEIRPPS